MMFVAAAYVFVPIYIVLRDRMLEPWDGKDMPLKFYNRRRILKLVALNIIGLGAITGAGIIMFTSFMYKTDVQLRNSGVLAAIVFFAFTVMLTAYGAGMYITTIITEQYILQSLYKSKQYKVLDVSLKLFHGPLSHLLAFIGQHTMLMSFCFIEQVTKPAAGNIYVFMFTGIALGIILGASQIANFTWKHQLTWNSAVWWTYVVGSLLFRPQAMLLPYNLAFLCASTAFHSVLWAKYIHHKVTGEKYRYDNSEYLVDLLK